jgi:hypothetical protein
MPPVSAQVHGPGPGLNALRTHCGPAGLIRRGRRRYDHRLVLRFAAAALLAAAPAAALEGFGQGSVAEAVARLKPGEFLWAPQIAPEGPVLLIVSTATQRAILYRNGVPIAVTTVSTGRDGHRTPTGVFTILQKHVRHFSNLYDNAPMPYMQRLTWQGVALHGGHLPGYPDSHGCIRLPHAFAKLLFDVTHLGMTVIVSDQAGVPRLAPAGEPLPQAGGAPVGAPRWHPERAPAGPVSIVISAADRRVVVLRNGIEIGSAPVAIDGPVRGTAAYVLRTLEGARRWSAVGLGTAAGSGAAEADWSRFHVDAGFRADVAGVVTPGTTVLVTEDSLAPGAPPPATLIEAEPLRP